MEQMWTELFYQETDAGKRQALLAQNSEKDNEAAALFREKLSDCQVWKEKSEERCICRLSYGTEVSVGRVCYRSWRQKRGRQHRSSIRCVCPASVNSRKNAGKFCYLN